MLALAIRKWFTVYGVGSTASLIDFFLTGEN